MGVLAAGFTYLAHVMEGTRDLATPVFAISGTLVALILPAASLSAQYIEPRLNYWTEELAIQQVDEAAIQGRGRDAIAAMESVVAPLWRGFLFALVSLPLSAAALFRPNVHVYSISAEEILTGASMGFVIVAVFSFLPFIWEILQLDLARETRASLFAAVPGPTAEGAPKSPGQQITADTRAERSVGGSRRRDAAGGTAARRGRGKRRASASRRRSQSAAVRPLRLHEAIIQVLEKAGEPLSARDIAERIREDNLYEPPRSGHELRGGQVSARVGNATYRDRFVRRDGRIWLADRTLP